MKEFFDEVRRRFGNLNQKQVEGFNLIVREVKNLPRKHQAYILATTWHETGGTMEPIEEWGKGKSKIYGKVDPATGHAYYGRGYVQLTWKDNYIKAQKRLRELGVIGPEIDFVRHPVLVMKPELAVKILVIGMTEGWFTGKKLSDFNDYPSMRKVVNGVDKAHLIADYAEDFERALMVIRDEPVLKPPLPDVSPVEVPKVETVPQAKDGILALVIGAALAVVGALFAIFTQGGN